MGPIRPGGPALWPLLLKTDMATCPFLKMDMQHGSYSDMRIEM